MVRYTYHLLATAEANIALKGLFLELLAKKQDFSDNLM